MHFENYHDFRIITMHTPFFFGLGENLVYLCNYRNSTKLMGKFLDREGIKNPQSRLFVFVGVYTDLTAFQLYNNREIS